MKSTRRKFIKTGLLWGAASLFLPPFLKNSYADYKTPYKLNYYPKPSTWNSDDIKISWLGHSTFLIKFFDKWILTDPVFFNRIGIYVLGATVGPSRLTPPALNINEIPKPDLLLLSHGHMDHTDYKSLEAIANKYPDQIDVLTSYLTKDITEDLPWKSLKEIDWKERINFKGIDITALEVNHFGWRFLWEKDRSRGYHKNGRSYNAYLLKYKGKKILFGGDTAITDKLEILKDENVDIAMMPIGAYQPWIRGHCNPEQALEIAEGINAKHFIPMHCMTFQQGMEPFYEPINWIKNSLPKYNLSLGIDEIGQTFSLKKAEKFAEID